MDNLLITLVQTPLIWENPQANRYMLEEKILAAKKSHVIILPEMFTTGFTMEPQHLAEKMDGETVTWMQRISRQKRAIITGSIIIEEKGQYYNRLLWVLPNGQTGFYDKRHLFAYAGEDKHYTGGDKKLMTQAKKWKILPLICYDLRFPVWCRQNENLYDLLIFTANWPSKRIDAWNTLLKARAIENQCFVIGVNRVGEDGNGIDYCGCSQVVDPNGTILFTSEEEVTKTIELNAQTLMQARRQFPFLHDADRFLITP